MWFYEGLSEHAHPNYLGMLGTYGGRLVDGWANIRGYAGSRLSTNP